MEAPGRLKPSRRVCPDLAGASPASGPATEPGDEKTGPGAAPVQIAIDRFRGDDDPAGRLGGVQQVDPTAAPHGEPDMENVDPVLLRRHGQDVAITNPRLL
jgi:hypothetical protein